MWAIIKFDKKNFNFFKKELKTRLGSNHILYCPKILIDKYKNNKLIKEEFNILGDYVFCYDKKLQNSRTNSCSYGLQSVSGETYG